MVLQMLGEPLGQGDDRENRVHEARRWKYRGASHVDVLQAVDAALRVDYAVGSVGVHAGSAGMVVGVRIWHGVTGDIDPAEIGQLPSDGLSKPR